MSLLRRLYSTASAMAPSITVHYIPVPASRVERIVWLLEELELKYDVKAHPFAGPVSPGMQKVSRLGKTPVLELDGKILTETGFIVHHLLERFPHPGLEQRASDSSCFWSHFAEGSMMLHLQPGRLIGIAQGALPRKPGTTAEQGQGIDTLGNWFRNGWVKKNVTLQLADVEEFLAANPNFSGSKLLGEGDFMMGYPLNGIAHTKHFGDFTLGAKTQEWLAGMHARPAFQRAVERMAKEDELAAEQAKVLKAAADAAKAAKAKM